MEFHIGYEITCLCVEDKLGIKLGESTEDGRVFLKEEEECIAACCGAPAMQVNHKYYEKHGKRFSLSLVSFWRRLVVAWDWPSSKTSFVDPNMIPMPNMRKRLESNSMHNMIYSSTTFSPQD